MNLMQCYFRRKMWCALVEKKGIGRNFLARRSTSGSHWKWIASHRCAQIMASETFLGRNAENSARADRSFINSDTRHTGGWLKWSLELESGCKQKNEYSRLGVLALAAVSSTSGLANVMNRLGSWPFFWSDTTASTMCRPSWKKRRH